MGVLILGDVHGCYYTLKSLLREHWNPEEDQLVLIGDLINKGPHSARTFKYWLKLKEQYPSRVYCIRGNHEQWFLGAYREREKTKAYQHLCSEFEERSLSAKEVAAEIGQMPLHFENDYLFVSHAGVSEAALDPFDTRNASGVLKNRKALKSLRKIQVIGHTIIDRDKPLFKASENAWYVDTGAWCRKYLSALHFQSEKIAPRIFQVPTKKKDKSKLN